MKRGGSQGKSQAKAAIATFRRDHRPLGVVALFIVLVGSMVGYNAWATDRERQTPLVVDVTARQRTLVERYIKDVTLQLDGVQADASASVETLRETADVLLRGGKVVSPQGSLDQRVTIPAAKTAAAKAKLAQERTLIRRLLDRGDAILAAGPDSPTFARDFRELRITGALLSSVTGDAAGQITADSERSLSGLVQVEIVLGVLSVLLALIMGWMLRRSGQRESARFRSLVHNSTDLITVLDGNGVIAYQSPSSSAVLGHPAELLVHTTLAAHVHPEDIYALDNALLLAKQRPGTATALQVRLRHADGAWRIMEGTLTDLLANRNVRGIVANTRDVTEREQAAMELAHQAFHDSLTGLANRALFNDRVDHALIRMQRITTTLCLVLIDLDEFKTVNDTLGHSTGDDLLRSIGERLVACARPYDTVARLGGDEFVVLMEDADEAAGVALAERIQEALREPMTFEGTAITLTASTGIVVAGAGAATRAELLSNADVAMYHAKFGGKARHQVFEPEMQHALVRRVELQRELRAAMEHQEFVLAFQPVVTLAERRLVGFEGLIRWQHPTRGIIPPVEFIPIAEEMGLIVPIGRWVLEEATQRLAEWNRSWSGPEPLHMSVNVSTRQFHNVNLVSTVAGVLARSGIAPEQLVLEVTETVLLEDSDRAIEQLHELKALGVRIAIDDFGTGFSSLSYLRRFPVDTIKIDKSFVDDITTDRRGNELAHTVIELSSVLGFDTVAEGIEENEQASALQAMGCAFGQGFLFDRPLSPSDALELVCAVGVRDLAEARD